LHRLVGHDGRARRRLPRRHRRRMASADLHRRPDHSLESVRDHLLRAGRPARCARRGGALVARDRAGARAARPRAREPCRTRRDAVHLLALRRCRVGRRIRGGLRGGTLMANPPGTPRTVEMPASTPAPLLSAAGLALLFAGLVTNAAASMVGAVLLLAGVVAWFRCVLPQEQEESVPIEPVAPIVPAARAVLRLEVGEAGHRARLPVMVYPYTAGITGGIAGGVAMALLALLYGLVA